MSIPRCGVMDIGFEDGYGAAMIKRLVSKLGTWCSIRRTVADGPFMGDRRSQGRGNEIDHGPNT
jgi:hypothetical protein